MLPKINPTQTNSWKKLEFLAQNTPPNLQNWFEKNPQRFENFSIETEHFLFDFSKNWLDEEIFNALISLAHECELKNAIEALFSGEKINETEKRAVLHTALRDFSEQEIILDEKNIKNDIRNSLKKIKDFSEKIHNGQHKSFNQKKITDIVNIGIGGSDLGPNMICNALKKYKKNINIHFLSNIDGQHFQYISEIINPETTIFLISSKTFTTEETLTNAKTAKKWFIEKTNCTDLSQHFFAISTNEKEVNFFGIPEKNIFHFWDWVGGRFSLWSSIGLGIALYIGFENFMELLKGAQSIDLHFRTSPFEKNIPVIMGLLGIWYRNFHHLPCYAILPYSENLTWFPSYIQQIDMESNGKSVDRNHQFISYPTSPVIFGNAGTNGQHAYYQLFHQGTTKIPADFIGFVNNYCEFNNHQQKLMAHFFAQTEALAFGQKNENPHQFFRGNSPSNSLLFKDLTPFSMGELTALYEHKVFVQGIIWNIFSFDQYGVELGKKLSKKIDEQLNHLVQNPSQNSSTQGLLNFYKNSKI